ncbi:IS110 family transposase [Streptomyces sp. NPDC091219]|uniref:IS110 family transposase n=1 Tax=Streptomyces sp. NPDC091219 TaxID=3155193 RepID=UPI00344CED8A
MGAGLRSGRGRAQRRRYHHGRRATHIPAYQITTALAEQTVAVAGTASAGEIVSGLDEALAVLLNRRDVREMRVAAVLEVHPLAKVLTSMPGVAVRSGARILAEAGDASVFPTAAHPASYAGLTPTTRRSGTSIRGEGPPRSGNETLKRALFLASFASLSSPESRVYDEGSERRRSVITPRSSASPAAASMSCTPCSSTAPSTNPRTNRQADQAHKP